MTTHISLKSPLNPGKYTTRDGGEAWVDAPPMGAQMSVTIPFLVGWVKSLSGYTPATWAPDGRYVPSSGNSILDLVGPWIDKPVFNHWDKIPGAKAVFLSHNKRWVAGSGVPTWRTASGVSYWTLESEDVDHDMYVWTVLLIKEHMPVWEGHPKDSLIIRPEGV